MAQVGSGRYTYEFVQDYLRLPPGESFGRITSVATDSQDRLYVLQRKNPPVMVFDRAGNFLSSWGSGTFMGPHAMNIYNDIAYTTDRDDSVAVVYTLDGRPLQIIGERGVHSDTGCEKRTGPVLRAAGPFNNVTAIALSPSGDLYITDGDRNARVHRYSRDGKLLASWGEPGSGPGQFHVPHAAVVAPDGKVYVCDRGNKRVQIFTADGKYLGEWTGMGGPGNIVRDADGVYYICEQGSDGHEGQVNIRDESGAVLARFATRQVHWLCMDAHGDIYLGSAKHCSVDKLVRKR